MGTSYNNIINYLYPIDNKYDFFFKSKNEIVDMNKIKNPIIFMDSGIISSYLFADK